MSSLRLPLALLIFVTAATIAPAQPDDGERASKRYHDYASLSDRLRSLAVDPRVALTSLGKSFDERDVWAVTVSGPDPVPAVYLDAAHDGRELTASAVALAVLERVLALPSDSLDALLADVSLHVVPRVSPDAVELAIARPEYADGRIPRPLDDDRDGEADEDGPSDVNGDGKVSWMRVADPAGSWVADPADPRLLVEREDGDDGPFYRRYREGLDDDGDGLVNEDPLGGVNVLKNFPQGWEVPAVEPDGGPFAASERETIAVLEHIVAHPEIAFVVTLAQGRRPERPGVGTREPSGDDDAALDLVERVWEERTGRGFDVEYESPGSSVYGGAGQFWAAPEKDTPSPPAPRAVVSGSFLEWAHFQHGAVAVSPHVWVSAPTQADDGSDAEPEDEAGAAEGATEVDETREDAPDSEGEGKGDGEDSEPRDVRTHAWLEWFDARGDSPFVPWESFEHPTLGPVEIGGFPDDAWRVADGAVVDSLAADCVHLIREVAPLLGRVRLTDVAIEPLTGAFHRVSATVENTGRMPTLTSAATGSRLFAPTRAEIVVPDDVTLVDTPKSVRIGTLGPGERRRVEWLLRAPDGARVTVRAHSTRAGHDAVIVDVPPPPVEEATTPPNTTIVAPDPDAPGPQPIDGGPDPEEGER